MSFGPARHELREAALRSGSVDRWVVVLCAVIGGGLFVAGCSWVVL